MSSTQIQVVNGKMTNTSFTQLDSLFSTFTDTAQKPIVIYLHGGAIGRKKVEQQIENHLSVSAFKEADCFPIYLLYHSGILEVIVNNVLETFQTQAGGEDLDGGFDSLETILKRVSKSKEFTRLFRILAKRALKKIGGDVGKKFLNKEFSLPGGFESKLSAEQVQGMFSRFEERIDSVSEHSEVDDRLLAEVAGIEMMLGMVEDYDIGEIEALKKDLEKDEEVRKEAEESGFERKEGFEGIGVNIKLIWILVNILTRVIKRFVNKTHHGFFETLIEEILRQFAEAPIKQWWATLKSDMDQAFTHRNAEDREVFAGSALLKLLERHWDDLQTGGERKVFLIGTSAGTTMLSKFLRAAEDQRIDPKVKFHTLFVAPSLTIEEFHENIQDSQDRIQSIRVFGLNDSQERNDSVIKIYRNSILFLISGLLEDRVATPLLGMERVFKDQPPFQVRRAQNQPIQATQAFLHARSNFPFVWSSQEGRGPGLNNTGTKHQSIIKDPNVLQSLNEIIREKEPKEASENGNVVLTTSLGMGSNGFESQPKEKQRMLSFGNQAPGPGEHPWDKVYAELLEGGEKDKMLEADVTGNYSFGYKTEESDSGFEGLDKKLTFDQYDPDWPPKLQEAPHVWHLEDDFSQLNSAREHATAQAGGVVRIAHIDTGYDPEHITFPKTLVRHDLEQSFIPGEEGSKNARDREIGASGGVVKQPGHGTGTLSILAGAEVNIPKFNFNGPIGLQQQVEIVPIRIAKSVILTVNNKVFAKALEYIISLHDDPQTRIHVVSMSMGGLASRVWAELVNIAYEKGIFIVTAAGNNFAKKPVRTLVYPARFKRVVAACGVTYTFEPYKKSLWEDLTEMQGNYGPSQVMDWAMAAFTPNIPWARAGSRDEISLSGAGTSSATPQIAMTAALYRMKYFKELEQLPGWQQVEAIRHALFHSARKSVRDMNDSAFHLHFGQGILQARKALDIAPDPSKLSKTDPDRIGTVLSFLRMLTGFESVEDSEALYEMLDVELTQVIQQESDLQELLQDEEVDDFDKLDEEAKKEFVRVVVASEHASKTLKRFMREYYRST